MERKRARLRVMYDDEDCGDKRLSSRGKKRVIYTEYDDDDYEEDEEEEEDEEDDEQPGPSTQNTYDQRANEKRLLNVTCGNKNGMLDVEKLDRGEECIKCEHRWFTAPAFEEFGGKGSSKKWKTSIFYKDKPLQFWFEQGHLTTKGFKRRATETAKRKKILSPNHSSESSSGESEIQYGEETEEDDVRDEDWHPGSEELEAEEERVGSAKGGEVVDSGVDTSKEEEDKMEDEDTAAGADNNDGVFEEREPKMVSSTPEMSSLQKEVKVVVKRLPEKKTDCQSNPSENPQDDSWCKPLDEDVLTEEEREHNSSDVDESSNTTYTDSSWMSDPAIVGGAEEEIGEFTQSIERKNGRQKKIQTEMGNSAPATRSPGFKPETEDIGSTSSHTADLRSTEDTVTDKSSVSVIKDGGPATKSLTRLQLRRQEEETRVAQTSQTTDMGEAPPSRPSTSCDLDTMDLNQLRREKIKMQIKVLRLQEEYYTQKINKLKT